MRPCRPRRRQCPPLLVLGAVLLLALTACRAMAPQASEPAAPALPARPAWLVHDPATEARVGSWVGFQNGAWVGFVDPASRAERAYFGGDRFN